MRLASLGVGATERIKVSDDKEQIPIKWLCLEIFSFLANIIAPKQLVYYLYNNFLMGHCWIELGSFSTQSECPCHYDYKIISKTEFFSSPANLGVASQLRIESCSSVLLQSLNIPDLVLCEVISIQIALLTWLDFKW